MRDIFYKMDVYIADNKKVYIKFLQSSEINMMCFYQML